MLLVALAIAAESLTTAHAELIFDEFEDFTDVQKRVVPLQYPRDCDRRTLIGSIKSSGLQEGETYTEVKSGKTLVTRIPRIVKQDYVCEDIIKQMNKKKE